MRFDEPFDEPMPPLTEVIESVSRQHREETLLGLPLANLEVTFTGFIEIPVVARLTGL